MHPKQALISLLDCLKKTHNPCYCIPHLPAPAFQQDFFLRDTGVIHKEIYFSPPVKRANETKEKGKARAASKFFPSLLPCHPTKHINKHPPQCKPNQHTNLQQSLQGTFVRHLILQVAQKGKTSLKIYACSTEKSLTSTFQIFFEQINLKMRQMYILSMCSLYVLQWNVFPSNNLSRLKG